MRIAFIIHRKNYYRLLAPVVEEALRRGLRVECWHDWSQPRRGRRASEFPEAPPAFAAGQPEIRTFHGLPDLAERFRADSPEIVVSIDPPNLDVRAATKARWLWLQYSVDILLSKNRTLQGILDADVSAMHSPYWIGRVEEQHRHSDLAHEIRRKSIAVGVPELDAVHRIDPDEVRHRFGLPAGRPVVLYLPHPLRSNPQSFWMRHVFRPPTRLEQGARVLFGRRRDYWPHVIQGWNDRGLVRAVRAFCDRTGALLVTKERPKDEAPRYLKRASDLVIGDVSLYPPTILELLKVSSLCIHSYSTVVFEAAYCGVPSLCLAPDAADMDWDSIAPDVIPLGTIRDFYVRNVGLGGIYNWPGATYAVPLRDAFGGFPRWGLPDLPFDATASARYVERFLGFKDGRSSTRCIDVALTP